MAERVQSDEYRQIDPNFSIPEGLRVFTYGEAATEDAESGDFEQTAVFAEVDELIIDSDEDSEEPFDGDNTPETPMIFGIISQTITTAPDGSQVVSVVLDVEDVDAMSKYDVRFTS